ncbi:MULTISPECIES: iron-siderophore ABC transporter substrate-binding protein [Streptomyces]|uniref:Iron-siderophore ABC transporter substrate-binding protein n=1 Tax=Streptomyces venezuelae TaxID=54571 RepID=A0A5P2BD69_STRVZ|nr:MULTISPECIES: iron-siderophore ABC transporter substrate-binding protein [Streptomyces]NEA05717.1 iron-siderophore ABC transporter substrate-binding protein [Streptomyces sp. SID10116]MYY81955.1 ABC transporter substrate-binding protein [Streptomyces sp. SID335]MYZ18555.1 ABC transporter substrate-binding protein [Streptomyces sp. SID337]NDZ84301.1 iron-siderophore ABC transporter substrate-binding protein [Streptomyces sp. SID10115]NEB49279.1 iron-siderophore ABC transporter substrate-bind
MPHSRTPLHRHRALLTGSLALTGALALTACGSSDSDGNGTAAGSGGTHTVKTAMGDVKVPVNPRRVVVLDTAELDSAITLGVKPVGATHVEASSGFPGYLPKDEVSGVKDVGEMMTPNMEAIAALKPDLILTSKIRHAAKYDQLKAIAPTVMTETTGYPWKENFQVHADALGKRAEAKKVVADYTAHTKKVTRAIGGPAKAEQTKVNVLRFIEGADIRLYGDRSYIATLLKDVGLGRAPISAKAKDGFSYDLSPEKIDLADTDVIFRSTYGDPKKSKETQTVGSGLWKNMKAVRSGNVHTVDDELWIQGIGYTAADRILDEMQADLTKKK